MNCDELVSIRGEGERRGRWQPPPHGEGTELVPPVSETRESAVWLCGLAWFVCTRLGLAGPSVKQAHDLV